MGFVFAHTRSTNWEPHNVSISSATQITGPFTNNGLKIQNQGNVTLNVVMVSNGSSGTTNIYPNLPPYDFYSLNWKSGVAPSVTLNASAATQVNYVWYEEND